MHQVVASYVAPSLNAIHDTVRTRVVRVRIVCAQDVLLQSTVVFFLIFKQDKNTTVALLICLNIYIILISIGRVGIGGTLYRKAAF